jgi:hypothetical protein
MRFGLIAGAGGKGLAESGPVYPRSLLAGAVMEHVAACSAPARAEALVKTQGAQLACLCNWLRPSDLTPRPMARAGRFSPRLGTNCRSLKVFTAGRRWTYVTGTRSAASRPLQRNRYCPPRFVLRAASSVATLERYPVKLVHIRRLGNSFGIHAVGTG